MGHIGEFDMKVRLFLKAYRWRKIDPVPWTPLEKPLSECRLGLVSSAGLIRPDQDHFDEKVRGGDWSFREIPSDTDITTFIDSHRSESYDHDGIESDPNVAFPFDRVRELAERGRIGSVAPRHLSFMGSLTAVGKFMSETCPAMARIFKEDGVDVALLVPV